MPQLTRARISQRARRWIRAVCQDEGAARARTETVGLSIAERYTGRPDYLDKVKRAADDLVRQRFLRVEDVPAVLQSAERMWNAVMTTDPLP